MLWFDRHRAYRDVLSAYLDEQLEAAARERLERHLGDCDACRAELDELRATVGALRQMPAPVSRRSFALTPEQVAAPRPGGRPSGRPFPVAGRPLDLAMRVMAAGLAVALAAVLIVDAGGLTGGGTDQPAQPAAESGGDQAPVQSEDRDYNALEPSPTGVTGDPDEPVSSDTGGVGGPATGDSPTPELPPGAEPADDGAEPASNTPEPAAGAIEPDAEATEPAAEAPEQDAGKTADEDETAAGDGASAPASDESDGGIGALTVAEIALGAALAVLLAASLALAYARRRG
jgi:hypothetical protein